MRPGAVLSSAVLLACSLGAGRTTAANLQISPVMINFRADQNAAGINLQNQADNPVYGQVRVFLWEQQNGEDVLTPTRELLASPPIVQIAARSSQTIRLVRAAAPEQERERTYRVLIDEIDGGDGGAASGVDIRLRYSVPVFVAAAGAASEVLSWRFFRKQGEWMLTIQNSGQRHAQIGAMSVQNRAGQEFAISKGLFGYVLAGQSREWRLPLPKESALGGPLAIKVLVNGKPVSAGNAGVE
ncbi:MAG: fimbria/pilus periplasmic chaperone [Pseudomonadota bacterium]